MKLRTSDEITSEYRRWIEKSYLMIDELKSMDPSSVEDAFYRDLSFGTGGLRGLLGAGTNRMNVHTVARATQGLANYLLKNVSEDQPQVAISYDSRINSHLFSQITAEVFAANGFKVHIYSELMPVSCLSYAVRELSCCAGVMITASHNPAKYNGYKVYGSDGCQITTEAASAISAEIETVDTFSGVRKITFEDGLESGKISYISSSVYDSFVGDIKEQSVLFGDETDHNVAIVYSPLNGTGLKPVTRVLSETGFKNVSVVAEQRDPDGNFPTCPYPNPEIKEAMSLGLEWCRRVNADLLIATDPDCDRCGIAVKNSKDEYQLMTGNEVGLLLLDFICSQRIKHKAMPEHPVFVKTVVTTDLAEKIAENYGVETINVLTGFKFIGEVIGKLERQNRQNDYICGFEESYGYLTGAYVRDKDGVNAVLMICEMFAYYRSRGISLLEKLDELYGKYGYCLNTLHFYEFGGSSGMKKMQKIMEDFRSRSESIGCYKVDQIIDYSLGVNDLPKSDVLQFNLSNGSKFVVRPSGTEPKIKIYLSVYADVKDTAEKMEIELVSELEKIIGKF